MEIPPATGPAVGLLPVFWTPAPKSDPLAAARYMAARPGLRATALFPDSYFTDDANGRQARALFLSLISSGALEVALTLPGRPVLPLLMDTDNAKSSTVPVAALPPRFAWPQDVTEQIALARAAHRRRWRSDPSVVVLPWDAVQGPELAELSKFKLRWGLMASTPGSPVLIEDDRLSLVRPSLPPAGAATRRDWWKRGPGPGLSAGATWGPVQVATLEELAAWESWLSTETFRWAKVSETVRESVSTSVVRSPLPAPDFTPWIGDNEENRAWELLGIARRAVEDVTGLKGFDLKRVMRTGTVASVDNRNWELSDHGAVIRRMSQSRAVALDMESAVIAANGMRCRVPYGTLLCVSDKPLHGEIKLAGMADAFYRQRVQQHLEIGVQAMEALRKQERERLLSRKLRSFAEVAFQ